MIRKTMSSFVLATLFTLFVVLTTVAHSRTQSDDQWQIELVDWPTNLTELTDRSVQIDATGTIHVVYGGDKLHYAVQDGVNWITEVVDWTFGAGGYAALALDDSGSAYISYYDASNESIKFATNSGGTWSTHVVDTAVGLADSTSIALTDDGDVFVAYAADNDTATARDLYVASNATGSWSTEQVAATVHNGQLSPSLAINGFNLPSVAFRGGDEDLVYAEQSTSGWQIETVESEGDVGNWASLAFDTAANPHISYHAEIDDNVTEELRYAWRSGASWSSETVRAGNETGTGTALIVDSDGYPHILYRDVYAFAEMTFARYTFKDGDGWHERITVESPRREQTTLAYHPNIQKTVAVAVTYENVDSLSVYSHQDDSWQIETSIAAESVIGARSVVMENTSGVAYIAYDKASNRTSVMLAHRDEDGWVRETVATGGLQDAAMDAVGHVHLVYTNPLGELYYATNKTGVWQDEVVYIGHIGKTALAVTASGVPHIVYHKISFPETIYYANKGVSGWSQVYVATSSSGILDIDVDATGQPHMVYGSWTGPSMYYAHFDGETLLEEQIDFDYAVGRYGAITLDTTGTPHVVYAKIDDAGNNQELRYAVRDEGEWSVETVDDSGDTGYINTLVVTATGAQISYIDNAEQMLKLASHTGSDWSVADIDSVGETDSYVGMQMSLGVTEGDQLHVSYPHVGDAALRYAYQTAPYAVTITPDNASDSAEPGVIVNYMFEVHNTGTQDDTYDVTVTGNGWSTSVSETVGPVSAGSDAPLLVEVFVPQSAVADDQDTTIVAVTSQSDDAITASATITTTALALPSHDLFLPIVMQ